jgi:cellulose synthase/poly-beta-1,6-N-acetylglucosamine synthase-like glycosyltransferase
MFGDLLIIPLAAWLIVSGVACFGVYIAQRDRAPVTIGEIEPTVLIIPLRGIPTHLPELWRGICAQTHRPARVIFAVESAQDPAYAQLQKLTGGPPVEVIVAGEATRRGQKIHNMLAALGHLEANDAIVVFADCDIAPAADWLARLLRELDRQSIGMTSGYRWLMPTDERWSTAFVCVVNSSIASAPRDSKWANAWGGSMALRRHTIEALALPALWDRAVSDDLTISSAVRALGGKVRSPRDALVPALASYSWKDAIVFGRRQYLFTRTHAPRLWIVAAAATTIPLVGWTTALPLALMGNKLAISTIVLAYALDYTRARLRERIPRRLWGVESHRRIKWLDRWGTPAWLTLHAAVIWSTLFGRTIRWAGRTYSLDAKQRLQQNES